jgi:1-acyl-sn-glycerol-3-phosphate acyltransferase
LTARAKVRSGARIAGFGALTAGMLPGMLAHEALAARVGGGSTDAVRDRWVGAWSGAMLALFGLHVTADGPLPPTPHPRLIVSNHRSTADILILLRTFGGRMVSRADLAGWPLIGFAARSVGTVFVDRTDAASGATALRSMRTHLARGSSILVFPEGTTFPDDEVRPFHPGAFVAAARAGVDVLPVGLAYQTGSGAAFFGESFTKHLARMAAAEPSRVALCVGPVLEGGRRARAQDLRARTHEAVQSLVRRARRIVDTRDGAG